MVLREALAVLWEALAVLRDDLAILGETVVVLRETPPVPGGTFREIGSPGGTCEDLSEQATRGLLKREFSAPGDSSGRKPERGSVHCDMQPGKSHNQREFEILAVRLDVR